MPALGDERALPEMGAAGHGVASGEVDRPIEAGDRFGGAAFDDGDGGELVVVARFGELDINGLPAVRAGDVADVDRGLFERVVEVVDRVGVDVAEAIADVDARAETRDESEDRCPPSRLRLFAFVFGDEFAYPVELRRRLGLLACGLVVGVELGPVVLAPGRRGDLDWLWRRRPGFDRLEQPVDLGLLFSDDLL